MHNITLFLLSLLVAQPCTAWLVKYYATETVESYGLGRTSTTIKQVVTTAPLTVSPTSTSTKYFVEYINTDNLVAGIANITAEFLVLPNITGLPVSYLYGLPEESTATSPTITTHYYVPVTLSNPTSCTQTKFTYTDSVDLELPDYLTAQATHSSIAMYVTTYVSTISTNLGGQAVTTSRCDAYLNNKAISGARYIEGYLDECVDPRRSTCSAGENQEATGSGGCNGLYPPTVASNPTSVSTTGGSEGATKSGEAASTSGSMGSLGLWSFVIGIWFWLT